MWPFIIPAAISAGASLLGGILGRESQENQRASNEALQREFAQSSIQWRVEDAKKAGIHPMYALGAPSISPAVSVQNDPLAASVGSMGQDISRAMLASNTAEGRETQFSNSLQALGLERAQLQNELLKTQIASSLQRLKAGQIGPPMPSAGSVEIPPGPDTVFSHPQDKPEKSPPLMMGSERWSTDLNTSPMKAWEDRYGDEGPVAALMPLLVLWQDLKANYGSPSQWPDHVVKRLDAALGDVYTAGRRYIPSRERD